MEIIMNLNKVTQEFRVIIAGECFYYEDDLFMKIDVDQAFNFETNSINRFDEYDCVEWVKAKLIVG